MENWASGKPMMITHWDPDLYPSKPAPGIQELVLFGLLSGALRRNSPVLLKEVDLLLNPQIRMAFKDDGVLGQFDSLLSTQRFKVLLPPRNTDFGDFDPSVQPMTAVAHERDRKKRPYKTTFRRLSSADKAYCARLDKILVSANAIEFRKEFPAENNFARRLTSILSSPKRSWLRRPPFSGITPQMAETFLSWCWNPSRAVERLQSEGVEPHGREAYRSLLYQVADFEEYKAKHGSRTGSRALKNLLQSVYAYCELDREEASGTYMGSRIAELPLVEDSQEEDIPLFNAPPFLDRVLEIPVASNIGDILGRVLEEIPPEPLDGSTSLKLVENRCAHVADAFARYSVARKPVKWSPEVQHRWKAYRHRVQVGALVLSAASHLTGLQFISSFELREIAEWSPDALHALTYCAPPLVNLIRGGKAYDDRDTERARVARSLLETMESRI